MAINTEIERRFLVDGRGDKPWRNTVDIRHITQYYLDSNDIEFHEAIINYRGVSLVSISTEEFQILTKTNHWVSRMRVQNDSVIFTLKGKQHGVATTELLISTAIPSSIPSAMMFLRCVTIAPVSYTHLTLPTT